MENNKKILKVSKDKEQLTNNKNSSLHSTFQQICEITDNLIIPCLARIPFKNKHKLKMFSEKIKADGTEFQHFSLIKVIIKRNP